MNSHNAKADNVVSDEAVLVEADQNDVRVLRSKLVDVKNLSIAEDFDNGGDPYNSTGSHVIIKPKNDIEE